VRYDGPAHTTVRLPECTCFNARKSTLCVACWKCCRYGYLRAQLQTPLRDVELRKIRCRKELSPALRSYALLSLLTCPRWIPRSTYYRSRRRDTSARQETGYTRVVTSWSSVQAQKFLFLNFILLTLQYWIPSIFCPGSRCGLYLQYLQSSSCSDCGQHLTVPELVCLLTSASRMLLESFRDLARGRNV
jgi:hypothetical protein